MNKERPNDTAMIGNLSAKDILLEFYEEDSKLFRLLWTHSCQVAEMALEIASRFPKQADAEFVYDAALLHDIGIIRTNAPSIHCTGTEPYIRHGIIGAEMLRNFDPSLERYALVCERHTGAGISKEEILSESLPLPPRDFLPVSFEEKIICYADKFFSKSTTGTVKTVDSIRRDLAKFGHGQEERFNELNQLFNS